MNYWIKPFARLKIFYDTREQWLDAIDKEKFNQENLHLGEFRAGSWEDSRYNTYTFLYKEIKHDEDGFFVPGHFPEVYRTKEDLIEANKPSQYIHKYCGIERGNMEVKVDKKDKEAIEVLAKYEHKIIRDDQDYLMVEISDISDIDDYAKETNQGEYHLCFVQNNGYPELKTVFYNYLTSDLELVGPAMINITLLSNLDHFEIEKYLEKKNK